MSKEVQKTLSVGPFGVRIDAPAQKEFDKYYFEVEYKEVFKKSGQVDEDGDDLGVVEMKPVVRKIDIQEMLESQRDMVGVDSYCKALMLQGLNINDCNTDVSDSVQDFSQMPDSLADVMTAGDKAKEVFEKMDPALKGGHTTIEGFLNSLSQESIDAYIKGRIEALTPKKEVKEGE